MDRTLDCLYVAAVDAYIQSAECCRCKRRASDCMSYVVVVVIILLYVNGQQQRNKKEAQSYSTQADRQAVDRDTMRCDEWPSRLRSYVLNVSGRTSTRFSSHFPPLSPQLSTRVSKEYIRCQKKEEEEEEEEEERLHRLLLLLSALLSRADRRSKRRFPFPFSFSLTSSRLVPFSLAFIRLLVIC